MAIKNNYPDDKSSETRIVMDTKNIRHQTFVKRYCKQMQVVVTFWLVEI